MKGFSFVPVWKPIQNKDIALHAAALMRRITGEDVRVYNKEPGRFIILRGASDSRRVEG